MLQHSKGRSDWRYPKEKPPRKNLQLWEKAIGLATPRGSTGKPVLRKTTGPFAQKLPRHKGWYMSPHGAILYKNQSLGGCSKYMLSVGEPWSSSTRTKRCWTMGEETSQYTGNTFVSVEEGPGADEVTLNPAHTGKLGATEIRPETFQEALTVMENQTLWDTLTHGDAGEWIGESLQNGNMTFACDGSYIEKPDPERCSAAFVLRCKLTGKTVKGTIVEKGRHASNYRGKLLGVMCVLLLLKAATVMPREYRRCKGFCDKEGVIFHCNKPDERVKLNQSSNDLVRICKKLLRSLPMKMYFSYVKGHADRLTPFEHLTLAQ